MLKFLFKSKFLGFVKAPVGVFIPFLAFFGNKTCNIKKSSLINKKKQEKNQKIFQNCRTQPPLPSPIGNFQLFFSTLPLFTLFSRNVQWGTDLKFFFSILEQLGQSVGWSDCLSVRMSKMCKTSKSGIFYKNERLEIPKI